MIPQIVIEDCADSIKNELYRQYSYMHWNGMVDGISVIIRDILKDSPDKAYSRKALLEKLEDIKHVYKDLADGIMNGQIE